MKTTWLTAILAVGVLGLAPALAQSHYQGPAFTKGNWRKLLHERVAGLDFGQVARDVQPFLEPGETADLLNREVLLNLLQD